MKHELKTWPKYYEAVQNGLKPFEVRKNDRDFKFGDTLVLKEWDQFSEKYTNREFTVTVTYILDDPTYVKDGLVIMGIKPTEEVNS
jgi:ASC-1-like (ASCH) protein